MTPPASKTLGLLTLLLTAGCGCPRARQVTVEAAPPVVVTQRPPPAPAVTPACTAPERARLDIELVAQESDMLCWAAVTQMVGAWTGHPVTQCAQVRKGTPTCPCVACPASASVPDGPCNYGNWPDFSMVDLVASRTHDQALPLDQLQSEIACHHRPVAFSWHTDPAGGHIMLAYGYDGDFIEMLDPWAPCEGQTRLISYDEYVNGNIPGSSSHWDDFYDFTPMVTP